MYDASDSLCYRPSLIRRGEQAASDFTFSGRIIMVHSKIFSAHKKNNFILPSHSTSSEEREADLFVHPTNRARMEPNLGFERGAPGDVEAEAAGDTGDQQLR